jgi:hypothetical protein
MNGEVAWGLLGGVSVELRVLGLIASWQGSMPSLLLSSRSRWPSPPWWSRCDAPTRVAPMFFELSASVRRYFAQRLTPRRVTSSSVRTAYAVAVAVDVMQLLLGPFGWAGADAVLDVGAMYVTSRLLGFHPLLLPTFVLEFVPFAGMLPSRTGCVAMVVRARRRQGLVSDEPPDATPVIDVKAKRVE